MSSVSPECELEIDIDCSGLDIEIANESENNLKRDIRSFCSKDQNIHHQFTSDFKVVSRGRKPDDNPQDILDILLTHKDQLFSEGRLRSRKDKIWQRIKKTNRIVMTTNALYTFVQSNRYHILDLMLSTLSPERKSGNDTTSQGVGKTCSNDQEFILLDNVNQKILTEHSTGRIVSSSSLEKTAEAILKKRTKNEKRRGRKPSDDPKKILDVLLANKDRLLREGRIRTPTDGVWQQIKQEECFAMSAKALYTVVKTNRYNILEQIQPCLSSESEIDDCEITESSTSDHEMPSLLNEDEKECSDHSIGISSNDSKIVDKRLGRKTSDETKKTFDILLTNKDRLLIEGKPRGPKDIVWEQIKQDKGLVQSSKALYTFVKCNRHNILEQMQSCIPSEYCVPSMPSENCDDHPGQELKNTYSNNQPITESCSMDQDIPLVYITEQQMSFLLNGGEEEFSEHFMDISDPGQKIMTVHIDHNLSSTSLDDQEITHQQTTESEEVFKFPGNESADHPRKIFDILLAYKLELITKGKLRSPNDKVWADIKRDECLSLSTKALYKFVQSNMYNIFELMLSFVSTEHEVGSNNDYSDQELQWEVEDQDNRPNYNTRSKYQDKKVPSEHNQMIILQQTNSEGVVKHLERKPSDDPKKIFAILLANKARLLDAAKLRPPQDRVWTDIKREEGILSSSKALYKFVKSNRYNILFLIMSTESGIRTCNVIQRRKVKPRINQQDIRSFFSEYQETPSIQNTDQTISQTPQKVSKPLGRKPGDDPKKIFDILLTNKDRLLDAGRPRGPKDSVWEQIKQEECIVKSAKALYTFVKLNRYNILKVMLSSVPSESEVGNINDDLGQEPCQTVYADT